MGEVLDAVQPSVIKLRSLAAKGQVFKFDSYAKCWNAVAMLTWHFDRIEAFMAVIGSSTWNWEHPKVLKHLKDMMAINPDDIRESLQKNNAVLLEFASKTYGRVYGGMNRRHFFGRQKREGEIPKGPANACDFPESVFMRQKSKF